jgi:rhodanese-related sulfurtransferase
MGLFGRRVRSVAPIEAWDAQRAGTLLIVDVRQPQEWRSGVVPGAARIPLPELSRRTAELPEGNALAFLCRSGHRSVLAARHARRRGHEVVSIRGGMAAWSAECLPVSRPD